MPAAESTSTLVLVDVQPFFSDCVDWRLVLAVEHEVIGAKDMAVPVVVLEFGPNLFGDPRLRTHPNIMRHFIGPNAYGSWAVMTKYQKDGSDEVIAACGQKNFGMKRLRLCGVKTHACVKHTALGLSRKLPGSRIEIVKAACNCKCGFDDSWGNMPDAANIVLV